MHTPSTNTILTENEGSPSAPCQTKKLTLDRKNAIEPRTRRSPLSGRNYQGPLLDFVNTPEQPNAYDLDTQCLTGDQLSPVIPIITPVPLPYTARSKAVLSSMISGPRSEYEHQSDLSALRHEGHWLITNTRSCIAQSHVKHTGPICPS